MIRWLKKNSLQKKRVILRVDFNLPMKNGEIADDFRIHAHLPTIRALLDGKNTVIILTHVGKPNGKKIPSFSARLIAVRLSRLLKKKVEFIYDPFTPSAMKKILNAKPASVFLVENMRFWIGEEANDPKFAEKLSFLGEAFVQDAFGVIHRNHATLAVLPRFLPSYGGILLKKEIDSLSPLVRHPRRPFMIIMGGAKISTKLRLLRSFVKKADKIFLGGALANTALAAIGHRTGKSLIETGALNAAKKILMTSKNILLPKDAVVATSRSSETEVRRVDAVQENEIIFDIGPKTRVFFAKELRRAKTIFWNGPLGFAEEKKYAIGTLALAKNLQRIHAYKVIGGGDLIAFFDKYRLQNGIAHFASGGGSTLAFLAGEKLPGLKALKK